MSSDHTVIKNTCGQSQLEIEYKENVMLSKEINLYQQTFKHIVGNGLAFFLLHETSFILKIKKSCRHSISIIKM